MLARIAQHHHLGGGTEVAGLLPAHDLVVVHLGERRPERRLLRVLVELALPPECRARGDLGPVDHRHLVVQAHGKLLGRVGVGGTCRAIGVDGGLDGVAGGVKIFVLRRDDAQPRQEHHGRREHVQQGHSRLQAAGHRLHRNAMTRVVPIVQLAAAGDGDGGRLALEGLHRGRQRLLCLTRIRQQHGQGAVARPAGQVVATVHQQRHAGALVVGAGDEVARHGGPAHAADEDVADDVGREREVQGLGRRARGIEHLHRGRQAFDEARAVHAEHLGNVEF